MATEQEQIYPNEQFMIDVQHMLAHIRPIQVANLYISTLLTDDQRAAWGQKALDLYNAKVQEYPHGIRSIKDRIAQALRSKIDFFGSWGFQFVEKKSEWLPVIGLSTRDGVWQRGSLEQPLLNLLTTRAGKKKLPDQVYEETVTYGENPEDAILLFTELYHLHNLPRVETPDGAYQCSVKTGTVIRRLREDAASKIGDVYQEIGFWKIPAQSSENTPS
ncbi:MAG: hypothetical protein NUV98_06350 [Candidatus Roizmanbacteria bacterium]|nr:hypothetical protein [Candidatus Roizmanbacteria bacterium]